MAGRLSCPAIERRCSGWRRLASGDRWLQARNPAGTGPLPRAVLGRVRRLRAGHAAVQVSAMTRSNLGVVFALGATQTIAWASSYYLPAILAAPIARELDVTQTLVFGALSGALVISGILGPRVGHTIDMVGGRGMLAVSNGVLALGLGLLSFAYRPAAAVRGVDRDRRRHGHGPVRGGLRHPDADLRDGGAKADHRHHPDRGLRQHRRLAFDGLARGPLRLARHLPVLGADPSVAGAADQSHAAARDVAGSGQRRTGRAAHARARIR